MLKSSSPALSWEKTGYCAFSNCNCSPTECIIITSLLVSVAERVAHLPVFSKDVFGWRCCFCISTLLRCSHSRLIPVGGTPDPVTSTHSYTAPAVCFHTASVPKPSVHFNKDVSNRIHAGYVRQLVKVSRPWHLNLKCWIKGNWTLLGFLKKELKREGWMRSEVSHVVCVSAGHNSPTNPD